MDPDYFAQITFAKFRSMASNAIHTDFKIFGCSERRVLKFDLHSKLMEKCARKIEDGTEIFFDLKNPSVAEYFVDLIYTGKTKGLNADDYEDLLLITDFFGITNSNRLEGGFQPKKSVPENEIGSFEDRRVKVNGTNLVMGGNFGPQNSQVNNGNLENRTVLQIADVNRENARILKQNQVYNPNFENHLERIIPAGVARNYEIQSFQPEDQRGHFEEEEENHDDEESDYEYVPATNQERFPTKGCCPFTPCTFKAESERPKDIQALFMHTVDHFKGQIMEAYNVQENASRCYLCKLVFVSDGRTIFFHLAAEHHSLRGLVSGEHYENFVRSVQEVRGQNSDTNRGQHSDQSQGQHSDKRGQNPDQSQGQNFDVGQVKGQNAEIGNRKRKCEGENDKVRRKISNSAHCEDGDDEVGRKLYNGAKFENTNAEVRRKISNGANFENAEVRRKVSNGAHSENNEIRRKIPNRAHLESAELRRKISNGGCPVEECPVQLNYLREPYKIVNHFMQHFGSKVKSTYRRIYNTKDAKTKKCKICGKTLPQEINLISHILLNHEARNPTLQVGGYFEDFRMHWDSALTGEPSVRYANKNKGGEERIDVSEIHRRPNNAGSRAIFFSAL